MPNDIEALKADYTKTLPSGERLASSLREQLQAMISAAGLRLGVPIEARVIVAVS